MQYKIFLGDCLEKMKELEKDCIDLTVTSPLYDRLRSYKGSGTTGKMALKNGREFIGIEIVKEYFEIARKRVEKLYDYDINNSFDL